MTTWTLDRLRYTVRRITGNFDPTQLPDSSNPALPISQTNPAGIDDYINDFYLNDFDEHLRTLQLKTYYKFNTIANVGNYALPSNLMLGLPPIVYFTAQNPVYVDGYEVGWYQDPDLFYRIWPELKFIQHQVATGNGGTNYSFTLTQTPIQQGTIVIGYTPSNSGVSANESFFDAYEVGNFTNPAPLISNITSVSNGSSINYLTGAVIVNFSQNVPPGASINAHYYPYTASRPRDILFYQQQFFLKPIPNDVYEIKVIAYQQPTVLLTNSGLTQTQFDGSAITSEAPTYNEWWQVIAYGAALKILVEQGDHEEFATNKPYFEEAKLLAQRRALKQLANQRVQTTYNQSNQGMAAWPVFPQY